jgi:hypothetical protein
MDYNQGNANFKKYTADTGEFMKKMGDRMKQSA